MYKVLLALSFILPSALLPSDMKAQRLEGRSPVATLTESYVYVFNDAQYGHNRSLMGWSALPEVNFTKHIGFQTDFTSLYVRSVYPGQSRFLIAAGPRYNFAPREKFTPFIYGEAGEMRLTSQANRISDWNPVAKGGFGFDYKITPAFAVQLVPGEYLGQIQDDNSWNHSFSARIGIQFDLYR